MRGECAAGVDPPDRQRAVGQRTERAATADIGDLEPDALLGANAHDRQIAGRRDPEAPQRGHAHQPRNPARAPAKLLMGGVPADLLDKDYLASRRVRIALQGHQPFAAAVQAVYATLKALREGTPPGKLEDVAPAALMKRVLREADYDAWTRDYLGG